MSFINKHLLRNADCCKFILKEMKSMRNSIITLNKKILPQNALVYILNKLFSQNSLHEKFTLTKCIHSYLNFLLKLS